VSFAGVFSMNVLPKQCCFVLQCFTGVIGTDANRDKKQDELGDIIATVGLRPTTAL